MKTGSRPRVVVAGQVPPPHNGQNVMVARIVAEFAREPAFESEHLVFRFTPEAREMRRGSLRKVVELARVVIRLICLRRRGPIELLLFPSGGPQTTPLIRDLLLLPWVLLCAQRVVVQFHAAGIATRLSGRRDLLASLVAGLYSRCSAAVVMTHFNRCDPLALGIRAIDVIPHRLPDEFDARLVARIPGEVRLLCVGHLCPEKGTPDLLRAFAEVAGRHPELVLEFVGEPLPPLTEHGIRALVRELGLEQRVEWRGVLTGPAKQEAFGRASLFVFPSVAPFESFGLVLVEALMWALPIVATDWRGNREVLGPDFDGVCHSVTPNLSTSIAAGIEQALVQRTADPSFGSRNRDLFLARFRYDPDSHEYADHARRWLAL
jgi:glycosyltransferase involved in cell wall biosynthesis